MSATHALDADQADVGDVWGEEDIIIDEDGNAIVPGGDDIMGGDAGEGGGWDPEDDDLELPADLVRHSLPHFAPSLLCTPCAIRYRYVFLS